MKNIIKSLDKNILIIFLFLISIIMPLIWMEGDFLYIPEEALFINYQSLFEKNLYAWNEKINYGAPSESWYMSLLIPNAVFYKLLSLLNLNNHFIQIIFLQFILFITLISIGYFLKLFTNNKIIILTCSLFYIFNLYFYSSITYSAKMYQMILMPLFFVWMYRYLETKYIKYAIYNFLGLFSFQAIFSNLPQLLATFLVYLLAISYFVLAQNQGILSFSKKCWRKILFFFILIIPLFFYFGSVYYFSMIYGQDISELKSQLSFKVLTSPLYQIFQLRGAWWENQGYDGVYYNHWREFYNNSYRSAISFLITIFALSGALFTRKKNYILFLIFFLIFTLLASGSAFYPKIYEWLYMNIPFFYIFREPWAKFMPLVIFTLTALLALTLDSIKLVNIKKWVVLAYISLFVFVSVNSYPFFSPDFFDRSNLRWKKIFIKPPEYWYQYKEWTKENKDSYILPIPYQVDPYYKWYAGEIGNANVLMYNLFGHTNITGALSYHAILGKFGRVLDIFKEQDNYNFIKLGTIDHILEQKDIDYSLLNINLDRQNNIKSFFNENASINFSDKLFIYDIKPQFYLPRIYVAGVTH